MVIEFALPTPTGNVLLGHACGDVGRIPRAGPRHVHTTVTDIPNTDRATVSDAEVCVRNLVDRRNAKSATAGTRGSAIDVRVGSCDA